MRALTFAAFLILTTQLVRGDPVVQTESGSIRGINLGKVDAYLGIPYAEPPTGQLRFSKPVPKKPWTEMLDAKSLPNSCIQLEFQYEIFSPNTPVSEDCLFLNVWTPVTKDKDKLKTVMIFIHGGGFICGSSSMPLYSGEKLAEHGDVVVVTINYRLGALGFFTDLTEDAPGSQGLYDQVLAIQWIKDNAKHFQGDPENIVLFGESAGAFSVSMHQISPLSKNLFKRAILQSGSSINPQYTIANERITEISNFYANILGCAEAGAEMPPETTECLRKIPAEKFKQADMELFKTGQSIMMPRIGNDFLPEATIDMYKKGLFQNSEVMMGITRDEGVLLLVGIRPDLMGALFGGEIEGDVFNETTAYDAMKRMMSGSSSEDEKIIQSYLDDVNDKKMYLDVVNEAVGDILITCGNVFQAEYQSKRDIPVYFYMFDYRSPNSFFGEWMGVPHFSEVQYVFGNPLQGSFSEHEEELSMDIMDMWTTFAKTGNPTIPGSVQWPRFSYEDPKYLVIGKRDSIGLRPDHNRCERWRNRYRSTID